MTGTRYLHVTAVDTALVTLPELAHTITALAGLGLPAGDVYRVDAEGVTPLVVQHQGADDADVPHGQVSLCEPDGALVDALVYVSC